MSEEYERISGLEFGVLPIPFRSQLLSSRPREAGSLCIAQFGDVRDEKGFHWLPDLIDAMMDDYLRPGRVRFLIQASLIHPEYEPKSQAALERLKGYPRDSVRLVGLDGPLKPDSYYRLVSEADLVLCPYEAITYRNRSSGTLAEAIAAGIPTVVPQNCWLSSQPPPGSGKTFFDLESFIDAVRSICDDYPTYHSRARPAGTPGWPIIPRSAWSGYSWGNGVSPAPLPERLPDLSLSGKDSTDACSSLLQLGVLRTD